MTLLLGYGFLGRLLFKNLNQKYPVKVLSNNISDNPDKQFYLRDFNTIDASDSSFDGVEQIIHTIHTTVPATSMLDLRGDIANNIFPTINLLNIMQQRNIKKLIYISSGGAVYGNPKKQTIDESHPTDPLSGYGISKLAIEKYIQLYHKKSGIEYIILRPSNLFGPNQNLYKPQGIVGHLLNALNNMEEIDIWGNGEGKKDYLHVYDLVNAISLCLNHFDSVKNEAYNVASGFHYSVNEIIDVIEAAYNREIQKQYTQPRAFDVQNVLLDGTKLKQKLPFRPETTIEEFIKKDH